MNTESQLQNQTPTTAMEDGQRSKGLVSPPPNHPSNLTQLPVGYQNYSPFCQPEPQRLRPNSMCMRDYQYEHMSMPSPGACNGCWAPHGCHHGYPEMAYNYCMPPPFPHYQYGCYMPPMNEKIPCSKMAHHPSPFQRKPYSATPYRPRRRKQVTFQNVGDTPHSQQQAMSSSFAYVPSSNVSNEVVLVLKFCKI